MSPAAKKGRKASRSTYRLVSVKGARLVEGTLDQAIEAAQAIAADLRPSFGVTVVSEAGDAVAEVRSASMSPAAKKKARKGPGGPRPGAGRPPELEGEGPRLSVSLDEPSGLGALTYSQERGLTMGAAIRELLSAWHQDEAVRAAVAAWRASR